MKKYLLPLFAVFLPIWTSAQTKVEIDGVCYNLDSGSKQAEVVPGNRKHSGDLILPGTVMYGNVRYGVTSIGDNAFSSCKMLESVIIPESVTRIGDNAFFSCCSLESIIIPEGVSDIGSNAFYNCESLEVIILPKSLHTVHSSAFAFCPQIKDVYCYAGEVPSAKPNAFDGSNLKWATLHVPLGSIDNYKSTSPWSKFDNIVTDEKVEELNKTVLSVQGTFDLNGRSISSGGLPCPVSTVQEEGRVVVTITVDSDGKVVATSINLRTNTSNAELRKAAEDAAKKACFNRVDGVNNHQTGTITYYFKQR